MMARQGKVNALLSTADVDRYCPINDDGITLLTRAMTALKLSARGYHRILKVARTIADLAGSERIAQAHIAEAVGYRRGLDRG
jgi:magnesium chelatase family protein